MKFGRNKYMSKVGKRPIKIPKDVQVTLEGGFASVKGPKGTLKKSLPSQVQVLVEEIRRAQGNQAYKNDTFFLIGMDALDEAQRGIVDEWVAKANEAAKRNFIVAQDPTGFEGVLVQYVITEGLDQKPSLNGRTILMPISGVQGDALLGWYEAIRAGGVFGGVFASPKYFDGKKIDFEKVSADDIPQSAFDFYNSRAVKPIPSRALLRDLLSGHVTVNQLKEFSFFLPLAQKIPIDVLIKGARLALRTVGISA